MTKNVPSWHWTQQPNADEIKQRCVKSLQSDNWLGKKRDVETIKKLNEGKEKWKTENPEAYDDSVHRGTRHFLRNGNPNWKGGISKSFKENNRLKNSNWSKIKKYMFEKYPSCVDCGTNINLIVHHIIEWRFTHDDSIENLKVLCRSCHMKTHHKLNAEYKSVVSYR